MHDIQITHYTCYMITDHLQYMKSVSLYIHVSFRSHNINIFFIHFKLYIEELSAAYYWGINLMQYFIVDFLFLSNQVYELLNSGQIF